ncbi:MAG: glycosyltransferase family 9 protein [Proteobacteria bacterium]|nr:glycosyltransferase family 9 protein [Pseudomonadota bacterium]
MKILIVQTSFLGDTILSTPVISGIKQIYPDAELWMMTTPLSSKLIEHDPLLSGVIAYDKRGMDAGFKGLFAMARRIRQMGFQAVYSLHRSYRTSVLLFLSKIPVRIGFREAKLSFLYHQTFTRNPKDHDVIRNLSILKGHGDPSLFETDMRLFAPDPLTIGEKIRAHIPDKPYAVLVPGSAWETKMWHHDGFRKTASYLLDKGVGVLLLGAREDMETNAMVAKGIDVIDLAGKTSIPDALYIMKHANLVVCNDSMSLHMASAFKIPTVVIFCATSPAFGFGPWKNKARVVEKKLDCKPCSRHGGRRCPMGTDACMKDLDSADVISAINSLLDIS